MSDYRELAKNYIDAGFSLIPVNKSKCPALASWTEFQSRGMNNIEIEKHFKDCWGIGFVCGNYSSTIAIDWDTKYFLDPTLYETIKSEVPVSILEKLYVQSTQSGGFHWVFKLDKELIKGNQKLAMRHSTAYEKHITYTENFKNPRTRDNALKIAMADSSRVLVESREQGGYIVMAPSSGYKHVYGKIQHISAAEYEILIDIIRSYNEYNVVDTRSKLHDNYTDWAVSPFNDFNEKGDVLGLLLDHGWEEVDTRGKNIRLKRPGSPHSKSSALLDLDTNIFNCFTTSSVFPVGSGINASTVFNILECGEDWSATFHKLVEKGYGLK